MFVPSAAAVSRQGFEYAHVRISPTGAAPVVSNPLFVARAAGPVVLEHEPNNDRGARAAGRASLRHLRDLRRGWRPRPLPIPGPQGRDLVDRGVRRTNGFDGRSDLRGPEESEPRGRRKTSPAAMICRTGGPGLGSTRRPSTPHCAGRCPTMAFTRWRSATSMPRNGATLG